MQEAMPKLKTYLSPQSAQRTQRKLKNKEVRSQTQEKNGVMEYGRTGKALGKSMLHYSSTPLLQCAFIP
jgi:hypothetical protein